MPWSIECIFIAKKLAFKHKNTRRQICAGDKWRERERENERQKHAPNENATICSRCELWSATCFDLWRNRLQAQCRMPSSRLIGEQINAGTQSRRFIFIAGAVNLIRCTKRGDSVGSGKHTRHETTNTNEIKTAQRRMNNITLMCNQPNDFYCFDNSFDTVNDVNKLVNINVQFNSFFPVFFRSYSIANDSIMNPQRGHVIIIVLNAIFGECSIKKKVSTGRTLLKTI